MISVPEASLAVTLLGPADARHSLAARLLGAVPDILVRELSQMDETLLRSVSAGSHLVVHLGARQRTPVAVAAQVDVFAEFPVDAERLIRRATDMARRLAAGRLPPDLPPRLEPWSHTWRVTAQRISSRLLLAMGDSGASVQHIGSTAVPGLPAKPIIDLQLAVPRLIDLDLRAGSLSSAGVVDVRAQSPDAPGVLSDVPRGTDAGGAGWPKRIYAGVDEEQRFVVHGRAIGSPGWRFSLMMRDWLKDDPEARAEYAALKTRLVAQYARDAHFDRYTLAKEPWLTEASARAEGWAERSGWVVERAG